MPDPVLPLCVKPAEDGQKLLRFLEVHLNALPGDLHKWLRTGQIRRNGKRAKPFDRLVQGDLIRIPPQAATRAKPVLPATLPALAIIYEDQDLLIINKPAGLPSQGGSGHSRSLAADLAAWYAEADYVPAPAHRLDKDASGLVVCGKQHQFARRLAELFADNSGQQGLRKTYLAWVEGRLQAGTRLELQDWLLKDEASRRVISWKGDPNAVPPNYKPAVASLTGLFTKKERNNPLSLVLLNLHSGRTHQLRAQLASRNLPIVGDSKYGRSLPGQSLKLHAWHLRLPGKGDFYCAPPWPDPFRLDAELEQLAKDLVS